MRKRAVVDHSFVPTRWPWLNVVIIAFLVVVAWRPIWDAIAGFAHALAGLFAGVGK